MSTENVETIVPEFKEYRRKSISEMRPYVEGEDLSGVSISDQDQKNGSPKVGDMIARNPKNHEDQWLVAKQYFEDNLEEISEEGDSNEERTLSNTTANQAQNQVKDIEFWGDGDAFKLISKAWSEGEKWMKSTKAMEIENRGVLVQVSTLQGENVSEALQWLPGIKIKEEKDADGVVISRRLA